ncbi:MAG: head GIN domain-containing protein [Cyclobacteriaceae bacterium]
MKFIISSVLALSLVFSAVAQTKETRDVPRFRKISYRTPGKLYVRQGSPQKVVLEGNSETLQDIETIVKDDRLIIGNEDYNDWFSWRNNDRDRINVYITVENLNGLSVSGSGDLYGETIIKSDEMDLRVSGSGSMELEVDISGDLTADVSGSGDLRVKGNCRDLSSRVSGSGKVYIANEIRGRAKFGLSGSGKVLAAGRAESVQASISGSGKVLAADLVTESCDVTISGSGDVEINVKKELDAKITGSGSVHYKGNPSHVNSHSSGSGKIRRMEG